MLECLPERLLPWYAEHHRALPWRENKEPYRVWLSEIMLQQTRVEAVRGYYTRFLQQLPTIAALAEASEETLLKLWEGLGYYSRVRNLQKAARQIMERHGGAFPQTYDEVHALAGVGPYTAGAICSICFNLPTPAVDGNVLRVVSRFTASDAPVTEESVKRETTRALAEVYPEGHCGAFTQALMELGATVCLPNGAPLCESCPLQDLCEAAKQERQRDFPVKAAKKPRRVEERTVFLLRCGEKLAVCKRPNRGLLAGLWQFPDTLGTLSAQASLAQAEEWGVQPRGIEKVVKRTHIFTHVEWKLTGCYLQCTQEAAFSWFTEAEIKEKIGLPTAYRQFLEE